MAIPSTSVTSTRATARLVLGALLSSAALVVSLSGCSQPEAAADAGPRQMPPVAVLTAAAEVRELHSEVSSVGSLRSPKTTLVSSDVAGIIVSLDAPEGRAIRQGHVIAQLDDAQQGAAMGVAEARRKNAQSALDRIKPLVEEGVLARQNLDDGEAELATAEGLLREASTRRGRTRIVAPFGGLVGIQTAQLGQFISAGDPIIQLTQLDPLELVFGVPEDEASSVRVGQTVDAQVGRCGQTFQGIVQALDPQIDRQARTLSVQARVPNPERLLIPGMSARVRLSIGAADQALVIPREALVAHGTTYVVWTVTAENGVESMNVVPGRFFPDVVEITGGLEPGTQIVVAGHQKLRPGATVSPSPWEPTQNPDLALGSSGDDCESAR